MTAHSIKPTPTRRGVTEYVLFLLSILAYAVFLNYANLAMSFSFLNIALFIICLYNIFYGVSRDFDLSSVFYVFHIIFFCILPVIELSNSLVYWGGSPSVLDFYPEATLISIFLIVFFECIYRLFYRKRYHARSVRYPPKRYGPYAAVAISLIATVVVYWYNGFSPASVMFRNSDLTVREDLGQQSWLFYQYGIYPAPSIALIYYLHFCRRGIISTSVLVFLFLIANPFTGMARFQAATLYMAVLLSFFPILRRKKLFMSSLLMFGMFFIFPFLDLFRRFSSDDFRISWSSDFLYQGHFDSFQSFARVLDANIITWGNQIFGNILFFVPRSIWAGKPTGSGAFIAGEINLLFQNISMNYMAEGYVNFGISGCFLFIFLAAWLLARFDSDVRFCWRHLSEISKTFYLLAIGLTFFALRGDFLSAFSYTCGHFAMIVVIAVATQLQSFRKRNQLWPHRA